MWHVFEGVNAVMGYLDNIKLSLSCLRSPRDIGLNIHASPSVRTSKLLGGVDQAILRQTLSSRGGMATSCEYLSDSEVWQLTQPLRDIEALQVDMASSEDIQVSSNRERSEFQFISLYFSLFKLYNLYYVHLRNCHNTVRVPIIIFLICWDNKNFFNSL